MLYSICLPVFQFKSPETRLLLTPAPSVDFSISVIPLSRLAGRLFGFLGDRPPLKFGESFHDLVGAKTDAAFR